MRAHPVRGLTIVGAPSPPAGWEQLDRPIDEIDISRPSLFATGEADLLFARMRAERPVHFCPQSEFGPYWSITRYADIADILTSAEGWSSAAELGGATIYDQRTFMPQSGIMGMDPPRHANRRRAMAPAFGPGSVQRWEELFRASAREALDAVPTGVEADLNEVFGQKFALRNTANLLRIPEEEAIDLHRWSEAVASDQIPNGSRQREFVACAKRFTDLRRQLAAAAPNDDPISLLVHHPDTARISAAEFLGHVLVLITASYHSVRTAMTSSIFAMAAFPHERARLDSEPALVAALPDEVLRWHTPLSHVRRTALADAAIDDATVRRGDKVVLWLRSGNSDEAMFAEPERFQIDRANARAHLAFGAGIHRCIGARLASLQVRVAWQEIVARGLRFHFSRPPRRARSNAFAKYDECRAIVS